MSADQDQMNQLESKGMIVPDSRRALLSNELVVIVSAEQGAKVRSPKDLAGSGIRRIALGDPRAVPIGVYARRYLEKAGLWQAVAPDGRVGIDERIVVQSMEGLLLTVRRASDTVPAPSRPAAPAIAKSNTARA